MSHTSHFLLEWKNKSLLIAVLSKSNQVFTEISPFCESRILTHKKLVLCLSLPQGRGNMSMGLEQVQSRGNKITLLSIFCSVQCLPAQIVCL